MVSWLEQTLGSSSFACFILILILFIHININYKHILYFCFNLVQSRTMVSALLNSKSIYYPNCLEIFEFNAHCLCLQSHHLFQQAKFKQSAEVLLISYQNLNKSGLIF